MASIFGSRPKHKSPLPSYTDGYGGPRLTSNERERNPQWYSRVEFPIPGYRYRRIRLVLPIPPWLLGRTRSGRNHSWFSSALVYIIAIWVIYAFAKRFGTREKSWPKTPFLGDASTLVYERADLRRIWNWEIASGHYPSYRQIPSQLQFSTPPLNPGIPPPQKDPRGAKYGATSVGTGVSRSYFHNNVTSPAYPPRPVPGSVIDLDIVQEYCEFRKSQYVRDCLEVLRRGAGLNNGKSLRRGSDDQWKHIYTEGTDKENMTASTNDPGHVLLSVGTDPNVGLAFSKQAPLEPPFEFRAPTLPTPIPLLEGACDSDHPRIFHIFWAGPFTDTPYITILSFLFTQNVDLHLRLGALPRPRICRPQLWIWMDPGPAASVPNPHAQRDMYDALAKNPWSLPLLHPRFEDVVKFKLWNTTEQLDGVSEINDEWRASGGSLFNPDGHVYEVPRDEEEGTPSVSAHDATKNSVSTNDAMPRTKKGGIYEFLSSSASQRSDRIHSDMARFVLCHRFGGIYLDADTIFLRDWEELWGWRGAFAYQWSRWEKYNTAVLRMHRSSALGSFLFRTALKNNFDFHPTAVSKYVREAMLEGILSRLPDALFDPASLNTDGYQMDRPVFPLFTDFYHFFSPPREKSASPIIVGFDGFYRGAFSYHFHKLWREPLDPSRDWPELGPKFIKAERAGRYEAAKKAAKAASRDPGLVTPPVDVDGDFGDRATDDTRDLSWATVLKRTFEAYIRGEIPNMYGEYIVWS
ncbi:uncharacterized protein EI90DRAFT_836764 [Cantharellus anzutake]|uniref:uncharacterized protein n=1 Tax=Cantharellus anzutake TaxID=1750568 RepID=UPI0019069F37|nr:uncharacterized protein EI90DRAFT_836764 [Cantharellus anzutake]KAF8343171.1 hypothetical protein EI90DRAFT_836764 [Cantharellus anzutake]